MITEPMVENRISLLKGVLWPHVKSVRHMRVMLKSMKSIARWVSPRCLRQEVWTQGGRLKYSTIQQKSA